MKHILMAAASVMAVVSASAGYSSVGDGQDVVIMRRVIAPPNRVPVSQPTPSPGPSVTPTPSPSDTPLPEGPPVPGQTPTPSPTPTAAYELVVARGEISSVQKWPVASGVVTLDTEKYAVCRKADTKETVSSSFCSQLGPTPGVGLFPVAVSGNATYRTLIVSRADVLAASPVTNIDALCSSTVRVGTQSWKLRCDPSLISGRYGWIPTSGIWPTQAPPTDGTWKLNATAWKCFDTETGLEEASSLCPVTKPSETFSIPAGFDRDMRVIVPDRDAIAAELPFADADALCHRDGESVSISPSSTQLWYLRCDPDYLRRHLRRIPTVVYNVSGQRMPAAGAFGYQVSTSLSGIVCIDDDTGQTVTSETWRCNYLPLDSTAAYYDVPAIASQELRVVEFDWNWIAARVPTLGAATRSSWCARTVSVYPAVGTSVQDWRMSCTPGAARNHFERYVSTITAAGSSYNIAPFEDGFMVNGSSVRCRDTDTGLDTDSSNCTYLSKGGYEGRFRVPMAGYSHNLRRVSLVERDFREVAPSKGVADSWCDGTMSSNIRLDASSSNYLEYKVGCGAEFVREHFQKVAEGYSYASSSFNVLPLESGFQFDIDTYRCRDTDPGAGYAAASSCTYFPASYSPSVRVPAVAERQLRAINFSKADLLAAFPHSSKPYAICGGSVAIRSDPNASYNTYSVSCDNPDAVRIHYEEVARTTSTSSSTYNQLPLSSGFSFDVDSRACRDTDSATFRSSASSTACSYLDRRVPVGSRFTVPVESYDATAKTVTVRMSDVTAAAPWSSAPTQCNGGGLFSVRNEAGTVISSWKLICR